MKPLDKAIQHFGNTAGLANALNLKWPSAVTNWRIRNSVPPKHAFKIEELTGGKVTRHQLCPDFPWGEAPKKKAA